MLKRLTDPFLQNVKPPRAGRDDYTDMAQEGLILRVSHTGRKHWSVVYRVTGQGGYNRRTGRELKGRQQRLSIGQYPRLGLRDARIRADEIRSMADAGEDPKKLQLSEAEARAAEEANLRKSSVAAVAEEMLAIAKVELRRPRNVETTLRNHILPRFGKMQLGDVKHSDINKALADYQAQEKLGVAREFKKHMSKLMNFGLEHGYIEHSPMAGVKALPKGKLKERVLSSEHLAAIWKRAGEVGYPYGDLARLVILTGCRVHELEQATWDEIDFERRALVLSPERSKIKETVLIPFADHAWSIIEALPRWNSGPHLFSTSGGSKPVNSRTYMLKQLNKGLPDGSPQWSMHDLRHTFRTKLSELGIRSDIAERCIGHKVQGIEGVYNHYDYFNEKRDAAQQYADFVEGLNG